MNGIVAVDETLLAPIERRSAGSSELEIAVPIQMPRAPRSGRLQPGS